MHRVEQREMLFDCLKSDDICNNWLSRFTYCFYFLSRTPEVNDAGSFWWYYVKVRMYYDVDSVLVKLGREHIYLCVYTCACLPVRYNWQKCKLLTWFLCWRFIRYNNATFLNYRLKFYFHCTEAVERKLIVCCPLVVSLNVLRIRSHFTL